ncbi:NADH:ubiquinone oxidoreductase subunit NDUFA12 [Sandaracinobacteroides hominis]|uniref:NADH:ubiquinone oxidoreductase subunit NDUFA12 n=1 Tax=Sandaracinobacteroides hominis TaxID=2780086 RepID=UPI0018F2FC11|nr:NADH:ubiquinone oxidoreductase subunit NDUFA12 [Sandaracinobacteroides hominis]
MGFNLFTWWTGSTFGTWLKTVRFGTEVGRDADGNVYFEDRDGKSRTGRRWVIYAGSTDSSRVPPEWHLWLHHTRAEAPSQVPLPVKAWERPWRPNPTGSDRAELPKGALAAGGKRAPAAADYRPWTPGS